MEKNSKVLIRVEADGNGGGDRHYHLAMSHDEQALEEYCLKTFKVPVGKPEKFTWDDYYIINDSPILILPGLR